MGGLCFEQLSGLGEGRQRAIKGGAGAHDGVQLGGVGQVVTTDVGRLALHGVQLVHDLLLVVCQLLGHASKLGCQFGIFGLCGQLLRPVQRQVELAAAVVELAGLRAGALVVVQQLAGGGVQRFGQQLGTGVVVLQAQVFQADGQEYPVKMVVGTVADALERAGITLEGDDYTEPALSAMVTAGSKIEVHRVEYQDKVETQAVPYDTEYVYTSLYFRNTNRATTLQHGSEGQQTVTTRERWVDGELENSVVTDVTTTVEPTDHVVKTYGAGAPVSPLTGPDGTTNAPASYRKVLTGKATGYYSKSGKGSSGLGLGYGTVAVDPDVIPYGTLLYITSTDGSFVYGYAVATDTGIAVQDGRILVDLFYETYAESVINGAINVNVYVVG